MRTRNMTVALAAVAAAALAMSGCGGAGKGSAQLEFKGKCVDPKGAGIPAFTLAISRSTSTATAVPVNVTTKNGLYETRAQIAGPLGADAKVLGPKEETVTIAITANGYQSKTFKVTADRVLVREPNSMFFVLEPAS